jgi:SAM-dependent methyltransferase
MKLLRDKVSAAFGKRRGRKYVFSRLTSEQSGRPSDIARVLNLLNYTKTSTSTYSAADYPAGYHSIELDGEIIPGQRIPSERLSQLPVSLRGMRVLDLGCNQGGMLFEARKMGILSGVGIDFDSRMINAANKIKQFCDASNLDFFTFDLEKEDLETIVDFLPRLAVDIVFLLSVCMWIKTWKDVIRFSSRIAPRLLFESNGSPRQQAAQIDALHEMYSNVAMLAARSDDDPRQKNRSLFLCTNAVQSGCI